MKALNNRVSSFSFHRVLKIVQKIYKQIFEKEEVCLCSIKDADLKSTPLRTIDERQIQPVHPTNGQGVSIP